MNIIMIFFFVLLAILVPQFAISNNSQENEYNQQLQLVQGMFGADDHIGKFKFNFNVLIILLSYAIKLCN